MEQQNGASPVDSLPDLRRRLAEARIKAQIARDDLPYQRAAAEARVIDAAGGDEKNLGSNQAARDRAMALALYQDSGYMSKLAMLRMIESEQIRIETEVKIAEDERRQHEWDLRRRLVDILDSRGFPSDEVAEKGEHSTDEAEPIEALVDDFPAHGELFADDDETGLVPPNGRTEVEVPA